jgi:hypothetical protein
MRYYNAAMKLRTALLVLGGLVVGLAIGAPTRESVAHIAVCTLVGFGLAMLANLEDWLDGIDKRSH